MSDNPFEEMARVSASDTHPMERRVDKERRIQGSARAIRWACRIGMALFLSVGIGLIMLESALTFSWLRTVAYGFMACGIVCMVILFFMGGYVGGRGRMFLSQRMRDLADD